MLAAAFAALFQKGTRAERCQHQVFPIRLGTFDPRTLLSHLWRDSALKRLQSAIPVQEAEAVSAHLQVEEVVPREKDGGAFARVTYDVQPEGASQFEGWLKQRLDQTLPSIKPWWLIGSSKVHLVKVRCDENSARRAGVSRLTGVLNGSGQAVA